MKLNFSVEIKGLHLSENEVRYNKARALKNLLERRANRNNTKAFVNRRKKNKVAKQSRKHNRTK